MLLSHRRPCGRTRDGGGGRGHHRAVIVKKRNNNKTTTVIISIHGRRDVRDAAVCKKKREKETGARAWSTDVRVSTTSTNDWRRRSGRAREDHARLLLRSSPEHVWRRRRRRRFRVAATPSLTSGSWWWLFPANRFAPPPRTDTRDVVNRGGGAPCSFPVFSIRATRDSFIVPPVAPSCRSFVGYRRVIRRRRYCWKTADFPPEGFRITLVK